MEDGNWQDQTNTNARIYSDKTKDSTKQCTLSSLKEFVHQPQSNIEKKERNMVQIFISMEDNDWNGYWTAGLELLINFNRT